jgi:PAS domain S-box-containing protein
VQQDRQPSQPSSFDASDILTLLMDNALDLIITTDRNGLTTYTSPSIEFLLGYTPQERIGEESRNIVHPDDMPDIERAWLAIRNGALSLRLEIRLRHKDGHYVWMDVLTKLLFDAAGNYSGSISIARDVTVRRQMHETLLEQERLKAELAKEYELNRLKTKMMSRISHEFRTPLSVILIANDMLGKYLDRLTPERRLEQTSKIKDQVTHITDMLDDISLAMRGSINTTEYSYMRVKLDKEARRIVDEIAAQYPERTIHARIAEGIPAILGVPDLLRRLLRGIVHNALQYSDESVSIDVFMDDTNGVFIRVEDHGIGIPLEEQNRVFEAFYRGSNIHEVSGLGLGLTIARYAAEAHRGMLHLHSLVDRGTVVTVRLPTR